MANSRMNWRMRGTSMGVGVSASGGVFGGGAKKG